MIDDDTQIDPEQLHNLSTQVTWSDRADETRMQNGFPIPTGRIIQGEFFSISLIYSDVGEEFDLPDEDRPEDIAFVNGEIETDEEGTKSIIGDTLKVDQAYRRNGLGEKLSRAMAYIGVEQGCKWLETDFTNPRSLAMAAKIYGAERINFFEEDEITEEVRAIDLTLEEAMNKIADERERIRHWLAGKGMPQTDDELGAGRATGIKAKIDLEGFDISDFDVPVQTGVLPGSESVEGKPDSPSPVVIDANGGAASLSEKTAKTWFEYATNTSAPVIVIIGTANGTVPDFLFPLVEQTSAERPVFIVSTNYAYDEGPEVNSDAPYDSQVEAAKSGAILLRDVNINGLDEVLDVIDNAAGQGFTGPELQDFVVESFGTPEPLARYSE